MELVSKRLRMMFVWLSRGWECVVQLNDERENKQQLCLRTYDNCSIISFLLFIHHPSATITLRVFTVTS
jgi:hypothetical protein